MINNIYDLAKYYSIDTKNLTEEQIKLYIEHVVYKYTDCGASITFYDNGIKYGSIVEGWDEGYIEGNKLIYPFDEKEIEEDIEMIERRASMCWKEVNKEDGEVDWDVVIDLAING